MRTIGDTGNYAAPALRLSLPEVVAEYDNKLSGVDAALKAYEAATDALSFAVTVEGTFSEPVFDGRSHRPHPDHLRKCLLKSAWRYAYVRLKIGSIAPAGDRRRIDTLLEKPPAFTLENLRDVFGEYAIDPRSHILRGLAECFARLDPAFKSHEKVKIGVKGLPKRIIIERVGSWGSGGRDQLRDVIDAIAAYEERPRLEEDRMEAFLGQANIDTDAVPEWSDSIAYDQNAIVRRYGSLWKLVGYRNAPGDWIISEGYKSGWRKWDNPAPGLTLKRFQNGNAHLHFSPERLLTVNRALAEFYGEVLPDAPNNDEAKRPSTEVARDLQFYPTPDAVIDRVLDNLYRLPKGVRVLEPSCGDGRIMDAVMAQHHTAHILGIEYDAGRAAQARAKGHSVKIANFLDTEPDDRFDLVVMNPPFYGRHWKKHLDHAMKFIAPDGQLACILPASANDDGEFSTWGNTIPGAPSWHDLPVASFKASGTNISTGFVTWHRKEK